MSPLNALRLGDVTTGPGTTGRLAFARRLRYAGALIRAAQVAESTALAREMSGARVTRLKIR